jgi:hypothetical protein
MNRAIAFGVLWLCAAVLALTGCSGMGSVESTPTPSLYQQLGGMNSMNKLAGDVVNASMKDPRFSGLLRDVDPATASAKIANQLCAALGGGCARPYSDAQIDAASLHMTLAQRMAVKDNFTSSLNSLTSDPALRDAVMRTLGSRIDSIVGAVK